MPDDLNEQSDNHNLIESLSQVRSKGKNVLTYHPTEQIISDLDSGLQTRTKLNLDYMFSCCVSLLEF